jgi:hypothetical protein
MELNQKVKLDFILYSHQYNSFFLDKQGCFNSLHIIILAIIISLKWNLTVKQPYQ